MALLHSATARVVAALSVTQFIGWGSMFWLPAVIGPAMAADLQMPLPMIMAGPTVMLVLMAVTSWPLAPIFERRGARSVMIPGALLAVAGLVTLAFAQGPLSFLAAWILIGLAGAGMLTTPAQIAVTEVAGDKARQALGILILTGGLTPTIVWPLTGLLQGIWGWRGAVLVFAALVLLVCVPLHIYALARKPRASKTVQADTAPSRIDPLRLILLSSSFAANGFVTWGFALTIIILFEAGGLTPAEAMLAAAVIGIAQWGGRVLDFFAGRYIPPLIMGLTGAALFPLSFFFLIANAGFSATMGFAVLYGVAGGITAVARATLPLDVFPAGAYARASAQMAVPLNLAFASAPPIVAAILTAAGPQAALWLALVISVFAFCALLGLWHLRRKDRALANIV
ncbi:MFS transporter [Ketogulonicigenium vulgare]|nr:MFS transporter [Ketogulonicigenium vulgare]